jgi:hypothetical protein
MRYIIFSRLFTNKNYLTNYFQELAEFRQQLNLPLAGSESDRATVAKLEIGDRGFLGISSGSNPSPRKITLRVNPISRTHAEADAIQQAYDAGIRGGRARLIVDRVYAELAVKTAV